MRRIHRRYWTGMAGAAWVLAGLPAGAQEVTDAAPAPPAGRVVHAPNAGAPAVGVGSSEALGRVSLELEGVPAEEAARRLGAVLGTEVQIEGSSTRKVTLRLENAPAREALERAAAAIGATWRQVYVFSKDAGLALPAPVPTGLTVNLNLTDTSCQAAAIIAAKAAGARIEWDGELNGRVTLSAREMPVEEAMTQIAKAAGATWRVRTSFKLDATLPPPPPGSTPKPETTPPQAPEREIPAYERDRYRVGPDGKRIFRSMPKERRTRYNTLGRYGAKLQPMKTPDVARLEQISRLGSFAGIFSEENEERRAEQIQLFRQALETQAERLDKFSPSQRTVATRLSRTQLQTILDDTKALSEEQKKEVAPITDYLKQRIGELDKLLADTK